MYGRDDTKHGKAHYNYQTEFRTKMKQYETTTKVDVVEIFYQNTKSSNYYGILYPKS